jgi:hypothetical protein
VPADEQTIERFRNAFAEAEVFLGEPLGWPGVHRFEDEFGIVLPDPYRSFVATVSNGVSSGPPDRGLEALGEMPWGWPALAPAALARPFPLTATWLWGSGRPPPGPGVTPESVRDGILPLGGEGGDMYWVLVVTGPHRGHVWELDGGGAQPFGSEFGYTTGASGFGGWVAHWLAGLPWWNARRSAS